MYSRDDRDRNCDQSWKCKKCIIPCKSECYGRAYCEQCKYGYMNIVAKLKLRYTREELELLNDKCVYVKFALEDNKEQSNKRNSVLDRKIKIDQDVKMDTKLKDLIERCKKSSPTGCCEYCECTERQCLDSLLDEFTNRRLEN